MGRTPLSELKRSVSSESMAVPEAQPLIDLFPKMSWTGVHAKRV